MDSTTTLATVLGWIRHRKLGRLALSRLALLAADDFTGKPNSFALVRLRGIITPNIGCHCPNKLLIHPFNRELGVIRYGNLDFSWDGIINRMGFSKVENKLLSLEVRLEADPVNLKFLGVTVGHPLNDIAD